MKELKKLIDVKSIITLLFAVTLVILLLISVFKSETMFETVFLLFTNLCTAVFTYFFTKKGGDKVDREESTKSNDT
jgi:Ca2+/Na+ antiporter